MVLVNFSHFEDIVKILLNNPQFNEVEFIAIVGFNPDGNKENYDRIQQKVAQLQIQSYFGTYEEHEQIRLNSLLQQRLGEAQQAIVISFDGCPVSLFGRYEPYLSEEIPIKYIGEHEVIEASHSVLSRSYCKDRVLSRSLGLSDECYGLKLQHIPHLQPVEAWAIINTFDPMFASQLLRQTDSSDVTEFARQQMLVPAYFNKLDDFFRFLFFLDSNHSFVSDKKMLVYCSGIKLNEELTDFDMWRESYAPN